MKSSRENIAVGQFSELLALERGYSAEKARQIRNAAVLHDIGKLRLPKNILNKPGKLEPWEFEVIKTHTKIGAGMLSSMKGDLGEMARVICEYHHEWENGAGYWGIPAHCLPEYVSIVSVSDVFTSLIAKRPYKDAWLPEDALTYIQDRAGTQFNAVLTEVFLYLIQYDSRVPDIIVNI